MFYCIYKTTNTLNGKIYIGAHKTNDLSDNYLGSGILLRRAIKKYGRTHFVKDILYIFNNEKSMLIKEKELVNKNFISLPNTYNITEGGHGSFSYINSLPNQNHKADQRKKASCIAAAKLKNDPEHKKRREQARSSTIKQRILNGVNYTRNKNPEYINPAIHHRWISDVENQKSIFVHVNNLDSYITQGWISGRKYKTLNTGKKYKKRN